MQTGIGIGRTAVHILRSRLRPRHKRLGVDVLTGNAQAVAFWRSVGYKDYCMTLEILPAQDGRHAPAPDAPFGGGDDRG